MTDAGSELSARRIARWLGAGALLGTGVAAVLLVITTPKAATDTSFALGTVVFGFGIATWAATVGFGDSLTAVRARLGSDSGWTQRSARQAFAVLTWVGLGWSVAAVVASLAMVGL